MTDLVRAIEALPTRWNGSPVHSHLHGADPDLVSRKEVLAALRQSQDIEAAALDVELVADVMKREFGIPRNSTYRVITAALAPKAEEAPR